MYEELNMIFTFTIQKSFSQLLHYFSNSYIQKLRLQLANLPYFFRLSLSTTKKMTYDRLPIYKFWNLNVTEFYKMTETFFWM